MSLRAIEKIATELSTPITTYDKNKWSLGTLIKQMSGVNPEQNFIGPSPIALARPMEESTPFPLLFPHAITFSPTIDWVFLPESLASASAVRRIALYEYNKVNCTYNYKGFITMTLQTATAHTIRGFRMTRYLHTTGTVAVSGTTVTGASTQFTTEKIGAGARIGFGTTDPTAVTQWYYISSINSNTSITLTTSVLSTLSAGTPYIIEELRPAIVTTNATLPNGGLFVAKGINLDDFTPSGTTISASASTVDNLKLVYWLADASTVTNTVGASLMLDTQASTSQHDAYVLNGTTSVIAYKYNLRASGTITTGKMVLTGSNIVITGTQAVTGTLSQFNNGRLAVTNHGAGAGVKCLYFVTTTRIYRALVSNITNGNVTWQSDSRVEVPAGSPTTFPLTNTMQSIEYMDSIDRFLIATSGSSSMRSYVTRYPTTSGDQFDYNWGIDAKQIDQASSSNDTTPIPVNSLSIAWYLWGEGGVLHINRAGTTVTNSHMYAMPFGAHWDFASTTLQRAITPEFATPNCSNFVRLYVQEVANLGLNAMSVPTEPFRVYFRTSGISDNSGAWTLINQRGDLSGISTSTSIQFMFEFQTISLGFCIPSRILSVAVMYEDMATDSHYQPSVGQSSIATSKFAWRFSSSFGGTVPVLRIRLYDAVSGGILVDDTTTVPTGIWEKSTDNGTTWGAYDSLDKINDTTYIRYSPISLGSGIKVRALLTQN